MARQARSSDRVSILGIGELLWDCFDDTRRPGGAPANVAFHATQLGAEGIVCSRVGSDEAGDALIEYLGLRDMDPTTIQRDPDHPTGRVTVDTAHAGHPSYTIHEGAAWDYLAFDSVLERAARSASAVCFGTLAQRTPEARETIERCLSISVRAMLVYDVNLRPPWYGHETIDRSLRRCHAVKLNDKEASVLAEILGLPMSDLDDFASALTDRYEVRVVCVTRGENGCFISSDRARVELPGRRVEVIDAVGAGDAFTAALVCGLLWKWPLEPVALLANEVGALVASRSGAMPALGEEFGELVQRFG